MVDVDSVMKNHPNKFKTCDDAFQWFKCDIVWRVSSGKCGQIRIQAGVRVGLVQVGGAG